MATRSGLDGRATRAAVEDVNDRHCRAAVRSSR
jgi:hypothetical protein